MSDLTVQNPSAQSFSSTVSPVNSSPKVSAQVVAKNSSSPAVKAAGADATSNVEQSDSGNGSSQTVNAQSGETGNGSSISSSNIMTYRDSESGRLVVRLVDEESNAVISEFPSKTMLGNYPKLEASTDTPRFDTKA